MRRFLSFALLLLFAVAPASADKARILEQKPGSITFVVDENLPEPIDGFINGKSQAERYKFLGQSYYEADGTYIAASFWDQPLSTDNAPFFTGMVRAFADHRPISLSPDLIWMLISQAFSHDVNAAPEKFRDKMVDFDGKMDLVVQSNYPLYHPDFDWTAIVDGFAEQIDANTINDVAKIIKADFSTTGTVEDWQAIADKTEQLQKLGAGKWIRDLKPILKEFVKAAKGNPDQAFWQDIVMTTATYRLRGGACSEEEPTELDGWFLKFMPYDKDGRPTPSKVPHNYNKMPKEMSSVPVKYIEVDPETGQVIATIPLELSGGIAGYMADENDCVSFQLGWSVNRAEADENLKKIMEQADWLTLRVSKVPEELRAVQHYEFLRLDFTGKVEIPDWMYDLDIEELEINGDVSPALKKKLRERFDVRFR